MAQRRQHNWAKDTSHGFAIEIFTDTRLDCAVITNLTTGAPLGLADSISEAQELVGSRYKKGDATGFALWTRGIDGDFLQVARFDADGLMTWMVGTKAAA